MACAVQATATPYEFDDEAYGIASPAAGAGTAAGTGAGKLTGPSSSATDSPVQPTIATQQSQLEQQPEHEQQQLTAEQLSWQATAAAQGQVAPGSPWQQAWDTGCCHFYYYNEDQQITQVCLGGC